MKDYQARLTNELDRIIYLPLAQKDLKNPSHPQLGKQNNFYYEHVISPWSTYLFREMYAYRGTPSLPPPWNLKFQTWYEFEICTQGYPLLTDDDWWRHWPVTWLACNLQARNRYLMVQQKWKLTSSIDVFSQGDLPYKVSRSQHVSNLRNQKVVLECRIVCKICPSHLRIRRSYRGVWFESENFPKEMLLTWPKFHFNTKSGSGVT